MDMNSSTQAVLPAPLSTALRQKLGERAWSQRKLAAFLGRNESTVSLWLSGRQTPRSEDTQVTSKLAKFLDTIPEHVHELIALQKDPDAPPSVRRQITKWNDFQLLLRNNAFVRRAMDLRLSRTSAAGLRDRLLEQGYDVAAEVLEEYRRGLSAKMPSSNGRRSSRRHAGVGSRTRAANFADSTESREVLRQACRELNALFVRANNAVDERDAEACLRAACSQAAGPTSAEDAANRILDELVR